MHTHNINVRTAAQESSGRCDQNTSEENALQARALILKLDQVQEGVTVTVANITRYGDVQVEIRRNGFLDWHAWSFEPAFLADLESNLLRVQQN